nr:TAF6-like RNA polymerase II p300/CBP-associated factor-associated factor 65 kDa subunit 6L [Ciona intestinalis]|eukprot:XP_002128118.1 TAF6-like RNA polymerase II p300/CBP-associated factor-associated factor 65 kDa subunit 6L [Ciona intestinalis]
MTSTAPVEETRKFAVFSQESIQIYAESLGITDLPDAVKQTLAEDVSYRLRELVSKSTTFLRHARRKRLLANDVNRALYWSDTPAIHGSSNTLDFKQVADVHVPIDPTINLRDEIFDIELRPASSSTLSSVDVSCDKEEPMQLSEQSELDSEQETEVRLQPNTDQFTKYYSTLVESLLTDNKPVFCEMLTDLRSNPRVAPCVPYFVTFLTKASLVSHDLDKLSWMLYTMKAMLMNPNLSLVDYLNPLLSSAMYCVLEPLAASINPLNDHWLLRDYGARIITQIVHQYPQKTEEMLGSVKVATRNVLSDPTKPLCSQYGALAVIYYLGEEPVRTVLLPMLTKLVVDHIMPITNDRSLTSAHMKEDAQKVLGAVCHCLRRCFDKNSPNDPILLAQITELFGDTIYYNLQPYTPIGDLKKEIAPPQPSYPRFSSCELPTITPPTVKFPMHEMFDRVRSIFNKPIYINFGTPRPVVRKFGFHQNSSHRPNPYPQINVSHRKYRARSARLTRSYNLLTSYL